jgi:hypothetical protein
MLGSKPMLKQTVPAGPSVRLAVVASPRRQELTGVR